MGAIEPTEAELSNISLCAQKLWDLDDNKLEPEVHYGINVQGGKRTHWREDAAEHRLFRGVSSSVWQRPTYRTFYALLDNYIKETGKQETMTTHERHESQAFINEIVKTAPMQYVHRYLIAKNLASRDLAEFKQQLFRLWFEFYRRDGANDSSGFEHVFVGESDDNRTTGFHNWIQFFIEEAKEKLNYKGYIFARDGPPPDAYERIMQVQIDWDGESKAISTLPIGTSPEFEVALYTLYFLAGEQENNVSLLNYTLKIKCYRIRGDRISTTYIDLVRES